MRVPPDTLYLVAGGNKDRHRSDECTLETPSIYPVATPQLLYEHAEIQSKLCIPLLTYVHSLVLSI